MFYSRGIDFALNLGKKILHNYRRVHTRVNMGDYYQTVIIIERVLMRKNDPRYQIDTR